MMELESYVEKFFPARELKRGVDYEIVSYGVLDDKYLFQSVDRYFGINSNEIFHSELLNSQQMKNLLENHRKWKNAIGLIETPYPSGGKVVLFYKLKGPIHFDNAISCGFGVVKMLTGEYEGDYLLYYANSLIESELDILTDALEELLMLEVYLQLTNPEELYNHALEKLLADDPGCLAVLIWGNAGRILRRLEEIFAEKKVKCGNNKQ
jgi:hypothetical protein